MSESTAGRCRPAAPRPPPASPRSTPAIRTRPGRPIASSCSIGAGSGMQARAVDGMGAQARQAARAQPPAARRDRHDVSSIAGDRAPCPTDVRYVITLDADTRLPRDAVARLVGKMAHPLNRPRFDPAEQPRRRGLRRAAAARHAVAAGRRARARCSSASSPAQRHRPLCRRGLRRLPGPVRRGLLHRQGHLRRRRLRGRAAGPRARQRAAQPRPVRGHLRPRGPASRTSRSSRNSPPATTSPRRASIAGRAATGSCCPGCSAGCRRAGADKAEPRAGDRLLEDVRQSAAHPVGAGRRSSPCWRAGLLPLPAALVWTGFVLLTIALPTLLPVLGAIVPRRAGHHAAQPFRRARRGCRSSAGAVRAARRLSRPSGLADGRRDRADLVSAVRQPRHLLEWTTAAQSTSSLRLDWLGFYRADGGRASCIGVAGRAVRLAYAGSAAGRSPCPSCSPGCSRPRSRAG